ncbi:hypothetical protein Glove_19g432 [Diversispora epigaea]|uniref:Uncharacterized protein n=1 Tax=Diversispora epigaea TaxID=1348612 RepID=A0A397JP33_9GLOM|nr:hypothetical protein Glove_19g432 [Diversispora epigaea]
MKEVEIGIMSLNEEFLKILIYPGKYYYIKDYIATIPPIFQQFLPYFRCFIFQLIKSEIQLGLTERFLYQSFSTWLDRTYTSTNNPYIFELILRGSRDVLASQTFRNIFIIMLVSSNTEEKCTITKKINKSSISASFGMAKEREFVEENTMELVWKPTLPLR